jgi:hypothetical protein
MQQGVGILAAGDADGNAVSGLDQVEIADGLAGLFLDFAIEGIFYEGQTEHSHQGKGALEL